MPSFKRDSRDIISISAGENPTTLCEKWQLHRVFSSPKTKLVWDRGFARRPVISEHRFRTSRDVTVGVSSADIRGSVEGMANLRVLLLSRPDPISSQHEYYLECSLT